MCTTAMWGRSAMQTMIAAAAAVGSPQCVHQLCGVGIAAMQTMIAAAAVGSPHVYNSYDSSMQTMIAAAAVGSPHGTPAMWGR